MTDEKTAKLILRLLMKEITSLQEWKENMIRLMDYHETEKGFTPNIWREIKRMIES